MNQTQKKFAISKIKTIVSNKIRALSDTDTADRAFFVEATTLSAADAIEMIQNKIVSPRTDIEDFNADACLSRAYDFKQVLTDLRATVASGGEMPSDRHLCVYALDTDNQSYRSGVYFYYTGNITRCNNLIAIMDRAIEDIMLGGDQDALNAIRSMEKAAI